MVSIKEEKNKESIVKSSFTVGLMTFISRISGFIRDVIFASYLVQDQIQMHFLLHLKYQIFSEDFLLKVPLYNLLFQF